MKFPESFLWKIADRFRSGIPDIYIASDKFSMWIELKSLSGKLRPIQKYTILQLLANGQKVYVIKSLEELKIILGEQT